MKINSAKVISVKKWVEIEITHNKKKIAVNVTLIDGCVVGNANDGLSTAFLPYFDIFSDKVRKSHFDQIKKYVESHIK